MRPRPSGQFFSIRCAILVVYFLVFFRRCLPAMGLSSYQAYQPGVHTVSLFRGVLRKNVSTSGYYYWGNVTNSRSRPDFYQQTRRLRPRPLARCHRRPPPGRPTSLFLGASDPSRVPAVVLSLTSATHVVAPRNRSAGPYIVIFRRAGGIVMESRVSDGILFQ